VHVALKQLRRSILDGQGKVVQRVPAASGIVEVAVIWRANAGWRIKTIKIVPS
jgi:hypothetical protein